MSTFDWITTTPRLSPLEYIKKPLVIIRLLSLFFSTIVFGVVHNDCYMYDRCLFNDDKSACGFASFLGISTLILCIAFLLLDSIADNIPNYRTRYLVVVTDFGFNTFWAVLWFVTFCALCNRWQFTTDALLKDLDVGSGGPRAAIAFSFFTWITLTALAYNCSLSYKTVKLLANDNLQSTSSTDHPQPSSFRAYMSSNQSPPYHNFVPDVDLLDATSTRPAQLGTDSPLVGTKLPHGGNSAFANNLTDAYQP